MGDKGAQMEKQQTFFDFAARWGSPSILAASKALRAGWAVSHRRWSPHPGRGLWRRSHTCFSGPALWLPRGGGGHSGQDGRALRGAGQESGAGGSGRVPGGRCPGTCPSKMAYLMPSSPSL